MASKKIKRHSISLCMIVKDEQQLIAQSINSVKPVVDEIIIVDTGSTDRTCKIAAQLGARVIHHKWNGSKGQARDVYLKNASCPWILALDADERIARKDLPKLKSLTKDVNVPAYIFTRRDYTRYDLLRNWYPNDGKYPEEENFSDCPGWATTAYIRLFQKKEGIYYKEEYSAHTDRIRFSKRYRNRIKNCNVVIHHFQYLKGEKFVIKKQKENLKSEIKYVKKFPDNAWMHLNIGITLFSLKKDIRAINYLKKAIDIDRRFDMAYLILGVVYKEKSQHKKAVFNLKRALSINPSYADAWAVLGMVYQNQGRVKEAEETLKRAIKIHPGHLLAHNSLGVVYQNQHRLREAEVEYKTAIRLHPEFPDAYYNLASLYEVQEPF